MINQTKVIAIIPARGGSKGVPKKNIKILNNKPLIDYSIIEAKKSKYIDTIVVTTDNKEIKNVVKKFDVKIIDRPENLATDTALIIPVLVHAVNYLEKETFLGDCVIVLLQPTSPLRIANDIDMVIKKLVSTKADSAETFCEIEHSVSSYFTMENDNAFPYDKENLHKRRQDLPKLYRETGAVYACFKSLLLNDETIYGKKHKGVIIPKERSIDIDDLTDFKIAECLIKK